MEDQGPALSPTGLAGALDLDLSTSKATKLCSLQKLETK